MDLLHSSLVRVVSKNCNSNIFTFFLPTLMFVFKKLQLFSLTQGIFCFLSPQLFSLAQPESFSTSTIC